MTNKNNDLICSVANDIAQNFSEYVDNKACQLIKEENISEQEFHLMINIAIGHIIASTIKKSIIENELQSKQFVKNFTIGLLKYFKHLREYKSMH